MTRIFISYRRDDSATISGRIYDHLVRKFGRENVFKDVDSIGPAEEFPQAVRKAIQQSTVFLAVIGDRWLDIRDSNGTRRLDDPVDHVRIEIEMALERNLRLIPVLVHEARMATKAELPASIEKLADRNAISIRDDPDFRRDVLRLIQAIQRPKGGRRRIARVRRNARGFFGWFRERRALRRYRQQLIEEHRYFSFLGRARLLDLDKIYITLKVCDYVPTRERPDESDGDDPPNRAAMQAGALPPSEALLLDPPRLLVLGEPGSGKTTLLKYLALQIAMRDPDVGEFARKHIPNGAAKWADRIQRRLSAWNLNTAGCFCAGVGLLSCLVALFFSPHPVYGLQLLLVLGWLVLLLACNNIFARQSVAVYSAVSVAVLAFFGVSRWMPVWPVGIVGLSLLMMWQPYWTSPLVQGFRWLRDRWTRYPLPLYLTLNDQAGSTEPLMNRLARPLMKAGFADARGFLRRQLEAGRCLLLMDALDEVTDVRAREEIAQSMGRDQIHAHNATLVTCRVAAFEADRLEHGFPGFHRMEVQEFTDRQVELFIQNWFADLAPEDQPRRVEELFGALGRNGRMRLLAANPLLLSLMTLCFERDWKLPERRVDLYEKCVDVLLEEWDRARGLSAETHFDRSTKVNVLQSLAVRFHRQRVRQFSEQDLRDAIPAALAGLSPADGDLLLSEIRLRSNLIRKKSKTSFDFAHLTFQEYFTACDYAARGDQEELLTQLGDPWWREVILLFAGLQSDATELLARLTSHDLLLAAAALADARKVANPEFARVAGNIIDQLKSWLEDNRHHRQDAADALAELPRHETRTYLAEWSRREGPADVTLAAVLALGRCGDRLTLKDLWPQPGPVLRRLHGSLCRPDDELSPRIVMVLERLDFEWVFVPGGPFIMGEGPSQQQVQVGDFWIGKCPVTNAQFARFVEEAGYDAGSQWRAAFTPGKERHPVVYVSWEDANAYCKWAGVTLPAEKQWEKAARGTDGRRYPWGNPWDAGRCNNSGRGTTPVDHYPNGLSPYGCYDMAGNVSEWCSDSSGSARVNRGGSWDYLAASCRAAYRIAYQPTNRVSYLGFRVALVPSSQ